MPLYEHASEDRLGLPNTRNGRSVYSSHDIIFIRTHPTCKILCYNPDTRFAAPSDVHTSTHLQQNSTRTSHTTNILAYAVGYIHARTHTRLPSYIAHATNACILWPNVLVLVGVLEVVLVVGSSVLTVSCGGVDSEEVRGGNQLPSETVGKSGHLTRRHAICQHIMLLYK